MNKIISFIIPSYNVEKYLRKVLNSFLLQEQKNFQEKIEVIIVDDGSSDGTAEIAQEYVKRMPEVFRLLQKENGGHGSAINEGSRIAVGKYLKVIDADDWVVTENLPELIKKLEVCEADVVLNPFHMVDMQTGKREIYRMYIDDFAKNYTINDILQNWQKFSKCLSFHGIMYKRDFYQKYRHELPEKIFYEDQEYAAIPCCYASTIQPINIFLYQYMIGNAEQSVDSYNQLKRITQIEQIALRMLRYANESNTLSSQGKEYLLYKTEKVILSYYVIANIINPDKKSGRRYCRNLDMQIKKINFEFYRGMRKKSACYWLLNILNSNKVFYEKLINAKLYNFIKKKSGREIE